MQHLSLIPSDDAQTFDAFAAAHPMGSFYQVAAMAAFRKTLGWDVHSLVLKDSETIVGAMVLAGKKGRYEIAAGPLLDFTNEALVTEFLKLLEQYVKNIGGTTVDVYPRAVYQTRNSAGVVETGPHTEIIELFKNSGWKHKGFTVEYDYAMNRWVFVKGLSSIHTEEELLASYRQTTRQTVKKLHHEDYSIKKMGYDELSVVKDLIDSSNDRNDVHNRPLSYYQNLYETYGDTVEFLTVYHKDTTPISTGIFVHHPNELAYFHSGADSTYRHLYGGHFLQHYVMTRAVKAGVTRYNFYGVTGHFTKNPLLVYKAGFRGFVEEYVGGFTKVVSPGKHALKLAVKAPKAVAKRILKR